MKLNPFRNLDIREQAGNGNGNGNGHGSALLEEGHEARFQKIKTNIHRELLDSLDLSRIAEMSDDDLKADIRRLAEMVLKGRADLSGIDEERLVEELVAESFGLGPLEPYMHDPDVTDILVNGPNEVYVERFGQLQETNTVFADEEHLMQTIGRIVARVGRRIDENSPMVDARLPDGSRVNAIIPPLALGGPILSIRRFGHRPLQLEDLLAKDSICPEMVQFLNAVVEGRINLMISGGTGSGKTTLLNCISRFIPLGERLVTIEDSAELKLQRKHVVSLETRPANSEGTGDVTQRDLVRNSLRMRPDRILLGEVRGSEALDMLQAMNTGHEGSITTIHANDSHDALSRLEVMVSMTGFELPVAVIRRYIGSAITVVVHLARLKGGVRRIMRISEIVKVDSNGEYEVQELFGFRQTGLNDQGRAVGKFYSTGIVPSFLDRLAEGGLHVPVELFRKGELAGRKAPHHTTNSTPADSTSHDEAVSSLEPVSTVEPVLGDQAVSEVAPASNEEPRSNDEAVFDEAPGFKQEPAVDEAAIADEDLASIMDSTTDTDSDTDVDSTLLLDPTPLLDSSLPQSEGLDSDIGSNTIQMPPRNPSNEEDVD